MVQPLGADQSPVEEPFRFLFMHRIFYCSFLGSLVLASATACTKEKAEPQASSFFRVTQDGTAWEEKGTAIYDKSLASFSVLSSKAAAAGQTQTLYLGFVVPNLRTPVAASPITLEWRQLVGGDSETNQFSNVTVPTASTLQITRLDTVQKVIEGRFDATLLRNTRYTQQAEAMQLSEGSFRISYQDAPIRPQ
jgi:hypothetical protein